MTRAYRTAEGGRIDRKSVLHFKFDGRRLTGFSGDTLASALLAAGVHLTGRSFKYHRPRGIVSAGAEEPNALVRIGEGAHAVPNIRATQVELYEGLTAYSQNNWPTLRYDAGSLANSCARLLPPGFYYKTFMRPKWLWKWYEHYIRRAAGMGRAPTEPDPDVYDKRHIHCDVLVVGGGPAGLAAALAAGRTGARVILADEQSELGGSLLYENVSLEGAPAADWVERAHAELSAMSGIILLPRATVFGYYDHNYLAILERVADHRPASDELSPRQRLWKVRSKRVILATGAHERPLVFADNDRPGIMLAGAAQTYLNRYGVRIGNRPLIFTNNDSAYPYALDLAAAGGDIAAIVDLRSDPSQHPAAQRMADLRIEVLRGHAVVGTAGRKPNPRGANHGRSTPQVTAWLERHAALHATRLPCPAAGARPCTYSPSRAARSASTRSWRLSGRTNRRNWYAASGPAPASSWSVIAWLMAIRRAGRPRPTSDSLPMKQARHRPRANRRRWGRSGYCRLFRQRVPSGQGGKHFVDFQNDVTAADIGLAAREGYVSVEHAKRYTTTGMGTDQGKTSNLNALTLLARHIDQPIPATGTTTFRPPYTPVTLGALAGRDIGALYQPERRTPMQRWHEQRGAVFEAVGQWHRPYYYPRAGETKDQAVQREVLAVRNGVGLLDASTLGKIDIKGPDSAALLNWVYTNDWSKLAKGRCRYGLMCGEDGMVFDDGVTAHLGPEHFLMHTTSGNAERVFAWLEEWLQTEWPHLKARCTSVTDHFATVAIAGPHARRLLGALCHDIDLDSGAFPFMSVREGTVAGIPARVFQVSYTGELSYEVNVPAGYGMTLWRALLTSGEPFNVTPFGTEAMHVLRAEKGFIMVGQDTDGTVTPVDLGMEWAVSKRKEFLGKRSLSRADMMKPDRKQLVGLLTNDPAQVLPEGAHIAAELHAKPPMQAIGHVTSSYFSPTLGRSIALALLRRGRARIGETVSLPLDGSRAAAATICDPRFYDPDGARLHG